MLRALPEGAEVEFIEPPKRFLGAVETSHPLPADLIAEWELTDLSEV